MVQLTCLLIKNYGKKKTFPFLALKIKKKPIIQFSPHHKTHLHIYIYIYIYIYYITAVVSLLVYFTAFALIVFILTLL